MNRCVDKCDICNANLGDKDSINTLAFLQHGDMYTVAMVPRGYKCPSCNHEHTSDAQYYEEVCGPIGQAPYKTFPASTPRMHTMLL